jgi:hypothetical protein
MNRTKTVSEDRKTRATGVDLSGVVMPETRIRPRRSTQLDPLTVVVFFAVLLSSHVTLAQTQTADYEVIFEATWSEETHPVQFPQSPHFSPPVGGTHNSNVIFWEPGGIATFGIELMAETGNTSGLSNEINAEIVAGFADQSFVADGINSPGTTSLNITVDQSFSELTLVSMLAPSPDWFVGVHGLPLFDQGWWVPEIVVDLFAYDAGTDDGTTYESANADSSPPLPISLQGFPLEVGVPVGTMTIRRLPEPDLSLQLLVSLTLLALLGHRRRSASPDGHLAPPDTRADQVTLDYTRPRAPVQSSAFDQTTSCSWRGRPKRRVAVALRLQGHRDLQVSPKRRKLRLDRFQGSLQLCCQLRASRLQSKRRADGCSARSGCRSGQFGVPDQRRLRITPRGLVSSAIAATASPLIVVSAGRCERAADRIAGHRVAGRRGMRSCF